MDFDQFLRTCGLLPRAISPDGKWRRCPTADHPKKRNGAYKLSVDGTVGWARNWATDLTVSTWRTDKVISAEQRERNERLVREHLQREKYKRIRATSAVRAYWDESKPLRGGHKYLVDKGLSMVGCSGLRVHGEVLVVPMLIDGRLVDVQRIYPDGRKLFWKDASPRGAAFVIERRQAAVTAIAEGLATGLAVFQTVPSSRVVVAFNTGNLVPVIERLKPTGSVVFAADNDHGTLVRRGFNPGIEAARNAAELIGAGVAWPEGIRGTDWADYMREVGAQAAKRMQRLIQGQARFIAGVQA